MVHYIMPTIEMENITSLIPPQYTTFTEVPLKKEKKTTVKTQNIPADKTVLSKVNRTLVCKFCGSDKILNPKQYQELFDQYESEERLAEEFMCKPCEMAMRRNPFRFWTIYGDSYQILSKNLRAIFDVFRGSQRTQEDAVRMQTATENLMREHSISNTLYEYVIRESVPVGMAIKDIPYVGTVVLWVYEPKKQRIQLQPK